MACPVPVQRAQVVFPHEPSDAVFAAGLSRLPQVEEDTRRAVDPLARGERRTNQAKESGILVSAMGKRLRDQAS